MTSYHTLSFTLSRSSLHRTKESPFTFRWAARAAATAVATTSATATATATAAAAAITTTTASRPEIEVIQPGLALFLGTDIFQRERRIGKGSRARRGRWPGTLMAGRGGKV
jgi:hypothetical protein